MTTFLDYYKTILNKVSFDRDLFDKEYIKATRHLSEQEINELNKWLRSNGFQNILANRSHILQEATRKDMNILINSKCHILVT
jgi:hypothetical protein